MRTSLLFAAASALGAGAIAWTGTTFNSGQPLGLAVTAVIGVAFTLGLLELVLYRRENADLVSAIHGASADTQLADWLTRLPHALQQPVSQRLQGERVGLPAPVMSPYLVGLLVLLGLLGTFVGMVDTLQGAVLALQGSAELAAIRDGLAAPIQGLSTAFGTSVAGIAASAMLGLNGTLSRRERVMATRALDRLAAGPWQRHSLAHQRQQTYRALQQQADALPQLVQRLDATADALTRLGTQLPAQLQEQQQAFLDGSATRLATLAESVDHRLQQSMTASAEASVAALAPIAERTLATLASQGAQLQRQSADAHELHLKTAASQLAELVRKDNALLEERQRLMTELGALGASLQEATKSQQAAVENLVAASSRHLADTCKQFDATLAGEARRLTEIAADAAGSSAELASLGDAFGHGVQLYSESNRELMDTLVRIEAALEAATLRSDEQMGYYVAQAREIIDHSMLSQREVIDELRRLGETGELLATEAG